MKQVEKKKSSRNRAKHKTTSRRCLDFNVVKMFVSRIVQQPRRWNNLVKATKQLSTIAPPSASTSSSKGGSSFFQRLNSFLVGSAIGFGSCFYFIHQELKESNSKFENYLEKLEGRIKSLEKK